MNTTKINEDCKIIGREVFEDFKSSVLNFPIEAKITTETIEQIILTNVREQYGRKVLKNHITGNETLIQLKLIQDKVNEYQIIIEKTCWNWSGKKLKL